MSLTATRRLTGSVCWAIQTVPMPPSPICSRSLYGPMTVPGPSPTGCSSTVTTGLAAGASRKLPASSWARSKRLDLRRAAPVTRRRPGRGRPARSVGGRAFQRLRRKIVFARLMACIGCTRIELPPFSATNRVRT